MKGLEMLMRTVLLCSFVAVVTGQAAVAAAAPQAAPPRVAAPAPQAAPPSVVAPARTPPAAPPSLQTPPPAGAPGQTRPPAVVAPAQTPPQGRGGRGAPTPPTQAAGKVTRVVGTESSTGQNIKLDLTITDNYAGTPAKKTVTMLIGSGHSGMIRTSNRLPDGAGVSLNVDASAQMLTSPAGNKIRVQLTFEYTPAVEADANARSRVMPAQLHESLTVFLEDGQPLLVSQSADPATDRRVTVELMATVLK